MATVATGADRLMVDAKSRLIVALDVPSKDECLRIVESIGEFVGMFKIGLELFTSCGPELFKEMKAHGVSVFFDGKFHDIPNTVAQASRAATLHGVDMFNVHASGGARMLKAASDAVTKGTADANLQAKPILIAVTVLTSTSESELKNELGVSAPMEQQVVALAKLAQDNGVDGVVASAREVAAIRKACGNDFVIVTPGIRPSWAGADDQARIVTPADAMRNGSSYIVVGRPITQANDRRDAAKRIVEEMDSGLCRL